ncbi:DUF1573 domain-containing protein [Stieleria varia]|uniref:DUF1573 domain-containing protein n=1 Tax=Stieleria varia TaxID=2528005 RepID=UPI001E550B71|nr:DUF1573 domain-containing protein [Stieleria varia]
MLKFIALRTFDFGSYNTGASDEQASSCLLVFSCFAAIVGLSRNHVLGDEAIHKSEIVLSSEAVEKLPVYGRIMSNGEQSRHRLELGTAFLGSVFQGRVVVINSGEHGIRIERIKSSCGCTIAQSSEREISPEGSQSVLIQVSRKGLGAFAESVDVIISGRQHTIELKGRIQAPVWPQSELVIGEDGEGEVTLEIRDGTIALDSISFEPDSDQFKILEKRVLDDEVWLKIARNDSGQFYEAIHLQPRVEGDRKFEPVSIRVKYEGVIRAVPKTLYIAAARDLRFFLFGDVSSIIPKENSRIDVFIELKLKEGGTASKTVEAKMTVLKQGVSLSFSSDLSDWIRDASLSTDVEAKISCGEIGFTARFRFLDS